MNSYDLNLTFHSKLPTSLIMISEVVKKASRLSVGIRCQPLLYNWFYVEILI